MDILCPASVDQLRVDGGDAAPGSAGLATLSLADGTDIQAEVVVRAAVWLCGCGCLVRVPR